jgi:hypothetical protein
MNTELEELLRTGMERFTAAAPVPTGLAEKAARNRRRRRAIHGAAVAAAGAAAAVGIAVVVVPGAGGARPGPKPTPSAVSSAPGPRRAATAAELVAYATRAAAALPPFSPGPHQWIYTEILRAASSAGAGGFLFGPPDKRQTVRNWMRVDHRKSAALEHGKLVITALSTSLNLPPQPRGHRQIVAGELEGWPSTSYRYLNSLPSDPVRLRAVIAANVQHQHGGARDTAIFDAIYNLLQSTVLPPRLNAALYGVLTRLPGVHFDAATDLAGRPGQGLYMVREGYLKMEIVVNPRSYAYMGYEDVAVRAHTAVATDGTRQIRKGQVLGWESLLASGIVDRPGQLP